MLVYKPPKSIKINYRILEFSYRLGSTLWGYRGKIMGINWDIWTTLDNYSHKYLDFGGHLVSSRTPQLRKTYQNMIDFSKHMLSKNIAVAIIYSVYFNIKP